MPSNPAEKLVQQAASLAELGDWLRARREELAMSRSQVQMRLQGRVSSDHIRKIEAGERQPSATVLRELAIAYKVDPVWLLRFAGVLPASSVAEDPAPYDARPDPERLAKAIRGDQWLTNGEKRAMLELYESLRKAKEARG